MKKFRHIILVLLAAFIMAARYNSVIGEWYAVAIYPYVSAALSFSVAWIPVSMEEILIAAIACLMVGVGIRGVRQRNLKAILHEAEIAAWIVIWFYLGWGMNYFRESIYARGEIERQTYDEQVFMQFIHDYADSLNSSFVTLHETVEHTDIEVDIKERFSLVPDNFGLCKPHVWQKPKKLIFNRLYSAVGVAGYIGPFFSEIQLNADLLPGQIPFCHAHELSHLLGVNSEDEANFWAYQICRRSEIPEVRFSGYYSLLPYVLSNASRVLESGQYKEYLLSIKPEIRQMLVQQQEHWNGLYSKTLGSIQHKMYDAMLKGNKISSGTKNYMQVIDLIIATEY